MFAVRVKVGTPGHDTRRRGTAQADVQVSLTYSKHTLQQLWPNCLRSSKFRIRVRCSRFRTQLTCDILNSRCGPMDKAPAYGAGDSRFESVQWYKIEFLMNILNNITSYFTYMFRHKILWTHKKFSPGRARTSDLTVNSRSL